MTRGTIRVGNKRLHSPLKPLPGEIQIHIDRPHILGNQNYAESKLMIDVEKAVEKFRVDLDEDLKVGGPMSKEINRIVELLKLGRNVILMCWCAPKACHGDVIIEAVEKILAGE
jgi:hypothetical protein